MKVLIDACVLYPTVLRQIVLSVAATGLFAPLWSARILEEWARAAAKLGPEQEVLARGEIAATNALFPDASVAPRPETEAALWLPDPADVHVLAAAIDAGADVLLTLNLRDFPARELDGHGLRAEHPDAFLHRLWATHPEAVGGAVARVHAEAERLSGTGLDLRKLLKRARLPRLGRVLG